VYTLRLKKRSFIQQRHTETGVGQYFLLDIGD